MDHAIPNRPSLFLAADPAVPAHGRRLALRFLVAAGIGDVLAICVALAAASWLRFASPLADWGTDAHSIRWTDYGGHVLVGTALFTFICAHFQVYTLPNLLRFRALSASLLRAACTWLVAYVALAYLLHFDRPLSRVFIGIAFFLSVGALLTWRHFLHQIVLRAAVDGRLRQRVLFVDWSAQAVALAERMTYDRQHAFEIVGCVPPLHGGYTQIPPARVRKLVGGDLAALLQHQSIDTVVLADLNASDDEMVRLANLCEKEMVEFKVIPSCFQILVSGLHLESVSGVPVLGISRLPLDHPFSSALKQLVDLVGGIVGLLLSAPLIGLFGLLVFLESPGPIFYRQKRLGRDGSPFWIYKIRSMRLDAEGDGQVGWTRRADPRRLRIGTLMRQWNIDETPQFWNVLKGDMSLVGPRPERPELIRDFKEAIPHYNARHSIKPGITGWAQVNGLRGDTDLGERVRYDLYYIENWNPLLDFQIMFLTLFRRKNAC